MEETTEQLKKRIAELETMEKNRSETVSIGAHQMRTSLAAIKWILKMLIDGDAGPLTPEQNSLTQKAFESNERLCLLVTDMLRASHETDTTIKYTFAPTDIIKLMDDVVFQFVGESYKKGIELLFLKPDHVLPFIEADENTLRVVFENLIENAIKYSEQGDRVFISATETPDNLVLSIKDTGMGIPENDKTHIFEKFFRAENAKKSREGTGLGLYTVKTILERQGGTIQFESTEGTGTTITLTLPLRRKVIV